MMEGTKYFLLRQKERLHPFCHNVYLTKHYVETTFFRLAHEFSEDDLLKVFDMYQDSFVVVPKETILAEISL